MSDPRTVVIMSYAFCGFADVASVSIFMGGTVASVPSRSDESGKPRMARTAGGDAGDLMTACVAGTFSTGEGMMVLTVKP